MRHSIEVMVEVSLIKEPSALGGLGRKDTLALRRDGLKEGRRAKQQRNCLMHLVGGNSDKYVKEV